MKVHNLSIDSSQRGINVIASNSYYDTEGTYVIDAYSNTYSSPNNYVITLENPIYDVSTIKLISGRIPTPQLTTCTTNKTFSVDGNVFTLNETNYSNGYILAEDLELILAPPDSNVSLVVYDEDTDALNFSNVGDSNAFTFEFYTGTNGYHSTASQLTTPHQVMGFSSHDFNSNVNGEISSGMINLDGPNSLVLKLTAGSDAFTQDVYSSTPFYTGHILLDGSDYVNFNGTDDPVVHHFHSGPQKFIQDIRIEFFYMSHGRLIPYEFRNQDHILKFEITCSIDKLKGLPKVPVDEEIKKPISIPEIRENVYRWKKEYIYIALIVLVGLILLLFMKRTPTMYPRKISE
jgi:hypothetical protein